MQTEEQLRAWVERATGRTAYGQDQEVWSPDLLAAGVLRDASNSTDAPVE